MINLRQTTDLRAIRPDVSFAVPKVGIGLRWYFNQDSNYITSNTVDLYSDHVSGNCYVPVTNGAGDNLTVEFAPGGSGMSLDLSGTGANGLDTGTAANGTFYDIRVISKRGSSVALLAHNSGRLEPGLSFGISSVTAASPTVITVSGTHSVQTGESVTISGSAISGLNATRVATRISDTEFSVPYNNGGGATDPGADAVFTGGSFTMPSGYTHYSDVVFGVSYTNYSVCTFTFSGVPTDTSTITLIDNAGSPDTAIFEFDDDASGVTGGNVAVNPAGSGSTDGAVAAAALVAAINGDAIAITAYDWGSGQVVLYQNYDSAYGGNGTGVTAIETDDTAHWNTKTSVNVPATFSAGGIQPFSQVGPGECRYSGDAGGGYQGRGIEVLADGTQDTDSAAIDLTHTAPSPTADTSYESRGKIFIYIYGSIGGSAARTLEWLYSPDGRTTDDANSDDALEWVRVMEYLDSSGEAYNHIHDIYGLPNKVSKTTTAMGFSSDSTGTLANIFQYRFSSSGSSPDAHAWVQGWKLNG